jgi:DNA replication protein DnaC
MAALRSPRMLNDLLTARADGRLPSMMAAWARVGVLVIDDLGLQPLATQQAADLLEIIEDRAQRRSTIVTSQLPVALWHEALGEPTIADAILDRLLHNAHRIELHGESMRRTDQAGRGATTDATASKRRSPPVNQDTDSTIDPTCN